MKEEEKAFFTQGQAYELIVQMIQNRVIYFPRSNDANAWLGNDERIERLDAIGETLLALLRQLTGKPEMKASESEGLIREVARLEAETQTSEPEPF